MKDLLLEMTNFCRGVRLPAWILMLTGNQDLSHNLLTRFPFTKPAGTYEMSEELLSSAGAQEMETYAEEEPQLDHYDFSAELLSWRGRLSLV